MLINEAIILAGGLGTRLRDTVPDLPKCMAPVANRPFLFYVINYLRMQGITKFIFSLGYKHELIGTYLKEQFSTLDYQCSIETEPLGTGGAIKLACEKAVSKDLLVANGDTLFKVNISSLKEIHTRTGAACTLAIKPMKDFDRYGTVQLNAGGLVTGFEEKKYYSNGLINGGIYLLNRDSFLSFQWPEKFSFEKDYLEEQRSLYAADVQDGYFIDIGIPADYDRAQIELKRPSLDLQNIDHDWTIFIDRDGVVNPEKKDDYIRNWEEFTFYDGVKEAFYKLGNRFGKVIIVSNQRGVGRKLMTEDDLTNIHQRMKSGIESSGGRVDRIYYCTATDQKDPCRKPNPGMAYSAIQDFPSIDPAHTIMVGNKLSDMLFARNAGFYSVFLATTNPGTPYPHPDIDARFDSLPDFANSLG